LGIGGLEQVTPGALIGGNRVGGVAKVSGIEGVKVPVVGGDPLQHRYKAVKRLLGATANGPVRADALAARVGLTWRRMSCGDGAKGPRLYDFAEVPDPGSRAHRLVIRRAIDDGELAFFWCHTPTAATLADLVRVIGMRWAVEECFRASKGQVGLDHYQVRSYPGW